MSAIEGSRQASIRRVLESLVEERRHLRRTGANGALFEASGIAIAYWRNELVHSETNHNGPSPGMAADRASPSAGEGV